MSKIANCVQKYLKFGVKEIFQNTYPLGRAESTAAPAIGVHLLISERYGIISHAFYEEFFATSKVSLN